MKEWILIIATNLASTQGEIRDVSIETVDGFKTKIKCENTIKKLGHGLIETVGKSRNQQGIKGYKKSIPIINMKCIQIEK